MAYTITISDLENEQAQSLIFFLKSLAQTKEYTFLKIVQDKGEENLSDELTRELDNRYQHFKQHKHTYKDWDDIKHQYVKI